MSSCAKEIRRFAPSRGCASGDRVILVHGLLMSGHVFYPVGAHLARQGFLSILYDYPTRRACVEEHGAALCAFIEKEMESMRESEAGKLHFVTHSMGGLLLRVALRQLSPGTRSAIGRIVMITPPNKGSDVAEAVLRKLFFAEKIVKCLPDLSSVPHSFANTFPEPDETFEIGIIAGSHDRKVAVPSTHLAHERDHLILQSSHTAILFRKQTVHQTVHFLLHGTFEHHLKQGDLKP